MRRAFLLMFLAFTLIVCSTILHFLNQPYQKIRRADPELANLYLSCYHVLMRQKHFDSLLTRLIVENMDMESMGAAINYAADNKLYKFIPVIEKKCIYLQTLPKDTSWRIQITDTYTRVWKMEVADYYNNCYRLEELRADCNTQ